MTNCKCEGCEEEMFQAELFYEHGCDVGFDWKEGHRFFFALDKKGKWVAG